MRKDPLQKNDRFTEEIGQERFRLVMQHVPAMQAASVVVALVLSYSVRGVVSGANILVFLMLILAVTTSRVVLYILYRKARSKPFVARNWHGAYLLLALFSGMAWGSSAFLILPTGNLWLLTLFVIVMASLSASVTVSHSALKWAPAAWIAPAMLPFAVGSVTAGGHQGTILAFLILLYTSVMVLYSHKHHGTITSSILLRFENLHLVEEARRNEDRFRRIFQRHDAMMLLVAPDTGGIVDANLSAERYYGYPLSRLTQMTIADITALSSEDIRSAWEQALDGKYNRFEFPQRLADGEIRTVAIHASPVQFQEQTLLYCIIHDITDRIRADEALKENVAFTRAVLDNLPVGIAVNSVDPSVVFGYMNDNFPRFYRTTREALAEPDAFWKSVYEDPSFREEIRKKVLEDCASGDPKRMCWTNVPITREGEETRFISATNIPIPDKRLMVSMVWDNTERKRAEEEKRTLEERLIRAEKMEALGVLAGGVAHDLNNVLGVVIGYSELLLHREGISSAIRPPLEGIMKGGQRAAAIVQDLLDLARRGVLVKDVVNLNRIVVDFQKFPEFEGLTSFHPHVQIRVEHEPGLPNTTGSPVHLCKTLFNLVSNGCEAMPKGGILTIRTARQYLDKPIAGYDEVRKGDYVVLSVTDTGEGISDSDLKRIFEPFYTKKAMGRSGTGLGLAVVWGTVKDLNGYINVQSEEGKGSTFTLYFPVTGGEIPADNDPVPLSEYMGNGKSILIVDDVEEQRGMATEMLKKLNYNVSSVASGEEAVEYLKDHSCDLLVLDMIMDPGMDGLDTYRRVLEVSSKQKAIIVSGFSESDRVHAAQALGAGAYVRKPYVIEKLGLAVRKELAHTTGSG